MVNFSRPKIWLFAILKLCFGNNSFIVKLFLAEFFVYLYTNFSVMVSLKTEIKLMINVLAERFINPCIVLKI